MARKGISGKDIANVLGYDRVATVYDKINGHSGFKFDEAARIKRQFFPEYDIEYLFSSEEEKTKLQDPLSVGGGPS
ncbi:XRE family transcriptional regulator [Heyndrickxia acidiproducens]|uniref:XRE family transcriptional regulator n=1 Tax=Heyndrickxia acidiproducens TaxID=1121084 RepID=UPI003BF5C895